MKYRIIITFLLVILAPVFAAYGTADAQPVPPGACCMPDDSCTDNHSQSSCEYAGGVFRGYGTDCAEVVCGDYVDSVPAMDVWGFVVIVVLLGLGALYFMRRRRPAG